MSKNCKKITIKNFSKGDTAYIVVDAHGGDNYRIIDATITAVGKKYVTIGRRKFQDVNANYLHEIVNCGWADMLFKTRQDAEEYIEKVKLSLWLGSMSVYEVSKYSLEQLRKVKEILTEI